jgi:hypothetical protein
LIRRRSSARPRSRAAMPKPHPGADPRQPHQGQVGHERQKA